MMKVTMAKFVSIVNSKVIDENDLHQDKHLKSTILKSFAISLSIIMKQFKSICDR
jgi:hypothetical protein